MEATFALSPRERQILALRRRFPNVHSDLYEEAQKLGVPRERVDEIKSRAELMLGIKIVEQRRWRRSDEGIEWMKNSYYKFYA